ncbi:MAG: GNAT family N-acetyltransferase [Bacteroidota bacterium]
MTAPLYVRPVESEADWQAAQHIRTVVFIEEQACPPKEEWDGYDDSSRHVLGWLDDTPVATARWRTVSHGERLVAKLERFAVLAPYRGQGHGRQLVLRVMEDARRAGFDEQMLHAQAHLEAFYASLGFAATERRFVEAGIPHVEMVQRLGAN